ncbi:MAG TPA: phenylalanine--tRNA ligase subunit beta [Methanomassiliicoccales archaeon]|jgi:phenylalanyl-tRNA synthetase beta chain
MPVINFNFNDLVGLLGKDVPSSVVLERIPMIGADLHEFDAATGDTSIEFFPNRPDLYSVEGVARSLRAFMDIVPGLHVYPTKDSGIVMKVEETVSEVRPYVVAAVIKNVVMTDQIIRSLMELQEKLHLTVGRKRVKVAIGVHDLDKVSPPFVYKGAEPDSVSFVPLAKDEPMTMREVLEKHEKGVAYKSILEGKPLYPVILDANGDVLSFPPIINGRLTTVTTDTKNIFIDVTGMDYITISGVLNIVTTSIAERGGDIETVTIVQGRKKDVTPKLEPGLWKIDIAAANKWLGLELDSDGMAKCLARMGYSAEGKGKKLNVHSSAVRMDLIHPHDVIEDIAIGHGYENFGKVLPKTQTVGSERPIERAADLVRQLMVGYGFWEATTLTLTSKEDQFQHMRVHEQEVVEVLNPVSEDHTCLRLRLTPSLLAVLRKSKHRDLPQRIFEVGDIVDVKRRKNLAVMAIHSKAGFTEMKSVVEGVMRDLSVKFDLEPLESGMYIPGRGASVIVNGQCIGSFGELHPEVITAFELGYPVISFEVNLDVLVEGKVGKIF